MGNVCGTRAGDEFTIPCCGISGRPGYYEGGAFGRRAADYWTYICLSDGCGFTGSSTIRAGRCTPTTSKTMQSSGTSVDHAGAARSIT
jgi:hypothetical protein